MRVGFIGLGSMGLPMAQNIMKAGFSLSVFNRTKEKATAIIEQGAKWTSSPAELASQCDIVVSMVSNDAALKEIVESLMHASTLPAIHISMSTVSPNLCDELEKQHRDKGVAFLAAPVTGRPERAREGALWIFLSGENQSKMRAMPILEAMSKRVFDLGEHPRQASLFKLCNNFMILGFIELFAEATTVLEKSGISTSQAAEIWGNSIFDAPILHSYAPILTKLNFSEGGFALNLGLKDMRLLHASADHAQIAMPILDSLLEKLLTSMSLGREKFDWSAIMLLTREWAGLK